MVMLSTVYDVTAVVMYVVVAVDNDNDDNFIVIINVVFVAIFMLVVVMWRQRGRVVRAPDLKSEGRGFKSRSDH